MKKELIISIGLLFTHPYSLQAEKKRGFTVKKGIYLFLTTYLMAFSPEISFFQKASSQLNRLKKQKKKGPKSFKKDKCDSRKILDLG